MLKLTKLNKLDDKSFFLKEAHSVIESLPDVKTDGFGYKKEWNQNFFGCFCIGRKCKQQYFLQQNERGNGARCTCGEH